jgi:hypothetical protein
MEGRVIANTEQLSLIKPMVILKLKGEAQLTGGVDASGKQL